jgi:RNA polymerase sigma factor (sigma-70 family)
MTDGHSVTTWIGRLKDGESAAAQPLWERYFAQLVGLARERLRGADRRAADEEDIALAAFDSFCRAAEQNRFPKLDSRDDLWQLLVMLTARKSIDHCRHESRQKRGGNAVINDELEQVLSRDPDPAFAAMLVEEYQQRLASLDDPELRTLVQLKLEGYSNEEIAKHLACSLRTVERRLWVVRGLWNNGGSASETAS